MVFVLWIVCFVPCSCTVANLVELDYSRLTDDTLLFDSYTYSSAAILYKARFVVLVRIFHGAGVSNEIQLRPAEL